MRVVIYNRISKDDEGDNASLQSQYEMCQLYANSLNATVIERFGEDFTGMKIDRPKLNVMRQMIRNGKVDAVIVSSSDRLSRETPHMLELVYEMFANNVRFFIAFGNRELRNTSEDIYMLTIESAGNRRWRDMIIYNLDRQKQFMVNNGHFIGFGATKFGYYKVREGKYNILMPDPEEMKIVQLIYEYFIYQDLSIAEIVKRLRGTPTPGDRKGGQYNNRAKFGKGEWNYGTVRGILRDTSYIGTFHQKFKDIQKAISIPAIIDEDTWNSAQQKLDNGRILHKIGIKKHEWLMAKRLICDRCNHSMFGSSKKKKGGTYKSYYCSSVKKEVFTDYCHNGPFNADLVDTCVWNWVIELFDEPEALRDRLNAAKDLMQSQNADKYSRIQTINKIVADEVSKLEKIVDAMLDNPSEITKGILKQRQDHTQKLVDDLLAEKQELMSSMEDIVIDDSFINNFERYAKKMRGKLEDATFDQKRELIEALNVYGVLAEEDGIQVIYLKWYHHMFAIQIIPVIDNS